MIASAEILRGFEGGAALLAWFGGPPSFHDAVLLELRLVAGGPGLMRVHAWNMTSRTDAAGFFDLERHAVVTLAFEQATAIDCVGFDAAPGILARLRIVPAGDEARIEWDAVIGPEGALSVRGLAFALAPGKPSA